MYSSAEALLLLTLDAVCSSLAFPPSVSLLFPVWLHGPDEHSHKPHPPTTALAQVSLLPLCSMTDSDRHQPVRVDPSFSLPPPPCRV